MCALSEWQSGLQNSPLLGFLRSTSSARSAFCHWQLHRRRSRKKADSNQWGRNPEKILLVCCRSGCVAMDHTVPCPGAYALQCWVSTCASILELAQAIVANLNPQTEIHLPRQTTPSLPPLRYVPCVDCANNLLGLRQTIGLAECVRRTAQWHTTLRVSAPMARLFNFHPSFVARL